MFNKEKLAAVISAYKEYFSEHLKDEIYKWEAIAHFQKYWDVNADSMHIPMAAYRRQVSDIALF